MTAWTISPKTGFLLDKPTAELPPVINNIMSNLADLLADGTIREAIEALPFIEPERFAPMPDAQQERYFQVYSYLASAYIHAPNTHKLDIIPLQVAIPLVGLAKIVKRPPILAYALYTLANWRKIDPNGAIEVENLELLYQFLHKRDAAWFTLIHVEIEAEAAPAIAAIQPMIQAAKQGDSETVLAHLNTFADSLQTMMATLRRMPEQCQPQVYYHEVRPYIMGFEDVTFAGCYEGQPQSFAGETGAQSSVIPALIRALGIQHQETTMTKYLDVMQTYMPHAHRQFLQAIDQHAVREFIQQTNNTELRESYNHALKALLAFRQLHLRFAASYIANQADDTRGTGGTKFMTWLQRLIDETEAQML